METDGDTGNDAERDLSRRTRHDNRQRARMPARRALPPIRTLTVGPGISPGQPAAGSDRVADCNRRFGLSPTPECAASGTASVCHALSMLMHTNFCGLPHRPFGWTCAGSSAAAQAWSTTVPPRILDGDTDIGPYLLTVWSSPLRVGDQGLQKPRWPTRPLSDPAAVTEALAPPPGLPNGERHHPGRPREPRAGSFDRGTDRRGCGSRHGRGLLARTRLVGAGAAGQRGCGRSARTRQVSAGAA